MNLPNKLSVLRMCLVPVFVVIMVLTVLIPSFDVAGSILGVVVFLIASFTDMLDGKIARKQGLITDFGKFIDPLADKLMVIGALVVILYKYTAIRHLFVWAVLVVVFRELAITGVRLLAAGANVVIAAKYIGKIKTVSQMVCVSTVILEPLLARIPVLSFLGYLPLTYLSTAVMLIFTLWSGIDYMICYREFLDPTK
ncbi:MAG: CDP-diacylglycerol--glycerol-3-phosphate 3-phosphatidyltransferase [Ruminococcaceae bacterium]|nr:CDP-diacylglycerol--glycerol-3-phosphate 3-phosphatidyltransferase [Oscillospiraceae bacterium]